MKTIVLYNIKGGVGKTTIAYHLIYMLAELGHKCLALDLDPQASLTSMFVAENELEQINYLNVNSSSGPLLSDNGDLACMKKLEINNDIVLMTGGLDLLLLENPFNEAWNQCLNGNDNAFKIISSIYRMIQKEASGMDAEFCIIDLSPTFGALNKSALITSDYIVIPVIPDSLSVIGLRVLGNGLQTLRTEWEERLRKNVIDRSLPKGQIKPLGYIVTRYQTYQNAPVMAALNWINKIPSAFHENILGEKELVKAKVETDPYCLGMLKHYHSLIPMARENNMPIFALTPAKGAIGSNNQAVLTAFQDFKKLSLKILGAVKNEIQPAG